MRSLLFTFFKKKHLAREKKVSIQELFCRFQISENWNSGFCFWFWVPFTRLKALAGFV